MMKKYQSIREKHLVQILVEKHRNVLDPPDATPSHFVPYHADSKQTDLKSKDIEKMQKQKAGVMKLAIADSASPVVSVPMKKGSLRFCVSHRQLNFATARDDYLFLRMTVCISSLGETQMYSKLDAISGYW